MPRRFLLTVSEGRVLGTGPGFLGGETNSETSNTNVPVVPVVMTPDGVQEYGVRDSSTPVFLGNRCVIDVRHR